MRKHGNGLEVGRAGTMEVKATKGAESTKAPKKQTGGDLRSTKQLSQNQDFDLEEGGKQNGRI